MEEGRCPRCGHPLSASELGAGRCGNCGWQVAGASSGAVSGSTGDDSLTRPVPSGASTAWSGTQPPTIPPVPPLDAVTAPVIPQGGYQPPSLPRTGPRVRGEVPGAESSPPAYPRRAGGPYESRENTAALPPALSPEFGEDGSAERSARGRRLVWFSAVALVIILLLGAGGAVLLSNGQLAGLLGGGPGVLLATPTSTLSGGPPAPPPGFVRYTAAAYTIVYPQKWTQTRTTSATTDLTYFSNPAAQANFDIETVANGSDPQGLIDAFISQFGAAQLNGAPGTSSVSNRTTPTLVSLANQNWARESADVSVAAGEQNLTWHVVALAATNGQTTYVIGYFAPQAVFSAQDTAAFQPMLVSLQLVSAQP